MGFLEPHAPAASDQQRSMVSCPSCGSTLVQLQGWRELGGGAVMLQLRCPECLGWVVGSFRPEQVEQLDQELVNGRRVIVAFYHDLVRRNMEDLAKVFGAALELDLIGPDDFAPSSALRR
jgi:hypothetical protein